MSFTIKTVSQYGGLSVPRHVPNCVVNYYEMLLPGVSLAFRTMGLWLTLVSPYVSQLGYYRRFLS